MIIMEFEIKNFNNSGNWEMQKEKKSYINWTTSFFYNFSSSFPIT